MPDTYARDGAVPSTNPSATIVDFCAESLRLRGFPPLIANPRATALRCTIYMDRLDPWAAVFVRDLPQQRRPVSVPQMRALQAIVAQLEGWLPQ
jgi:hypothetical protein